MTTPPMNTDPMGMLDRFARRVLVGRLRGMQQGEIVLHDAQAISQLGEPADLHASMYIHRPRFYREAILGGKLSVAESYLRGDWDCDDLTGLFRIFIRNSESASWFENGLVSLVGLGHRIFHWWRSNTRSGSRRNIAEHYDLGNDFYRLWLDETMAYSCGIFASPTSSLHQASIEKFDRVCRKLDLQAQDELLEIGSGWGGFALHAAGNYGCHVTTTTISTAQHAVAEQRFKDEGMQSQVRLLHQDYRDLDGEYDKLVSIEMIEAVGYRNLDSYFRKCSQLLRPDGSFVLQAIVMPERGYSQYLRSVDFIQRFVFPGGCLPSLGAILESIGRASDLRLVHAEDFSPHYAETLRRWRQAFHERLEEVKQLGYPEEFIRLWNYYLCYCEAAFEERSVGILQIQFDKPKARTRYSQLGQINEVSRRKDFLPIS